MDAETIDRAVDIGRDCLMVAIKLSFPLLAVGLVIGFLVSLFQAATQIQEQTLAFIPKMAAVVATMFILMPWLIMVLMEYTEGLFLDMGRWFP